MMYSCSNHPPAAETSAQILLEESPEFLRADNALGNELRYYPYAEFFYYQIKGRTLYFTFFLYPA